MVRILFGQGTSVILVSGILLAVIGVSGKLERDTMGTADIPGGGRSGTSGTRDARENNATRSRGFAQSALGCL